MKKLIPVLVISMIIGITSMAHAIGLGVTGGGFFPTSSKFDVGAYGSAYLEYDLVPMFDIRLQGMYMDAESLKDKYLSGKRVKQVSTGGAALVKFTAPIPVINLYAAGGWGMYQNKIDDLDIDKWGNGVIGQVGVGYSILMIDMGLEASYIQNDTSVHDFSGYSVALLLGVSF